MDLERIAQAASLISLGLTAYMAWRAHRDRPRSPPGKHRRKRPRRRKR